MPHQLRAHQAQHKPSPACALCLLCALCGLAPLPCRAAQPARPYVGEAYILGQPPGQDQAQPPGLAPGLALRHTQASRTLRQGWLLEPSSALWAGGQGLRLTLDQAEVLLATQVLAASGDAHTAAASHADGRIELLGAANCTGVAMPDGHPAYALALARHGTILAAWAQGLNRLVYFDLTRPGCPASSVEVALRGQLRLTVSSSGAFVAAQDESGRLFVGARNDALHRVDTMAQTPAALGFSDGEGVLLAIDRQGRGGAWNPRTGAQLIALKVPGGPFAHGGFQAGEARLWTADGRLVRWNVLHNRPVQSQEAPPEALTDQNAGQLELRGTDLYFVQPGLSWRAKPLYEVHAPVLALSRHARCLRLSDLDGVVRYYDAQTGLPRSQCLAEDWAAVPVQPDGTARAPGLALRIFDQAARPGGQGLVNIRAISEHLVLLWTDSPPELALRVQAPAAGIPGGGFPVDPNRAAREDAPLAVDLRAGLGADEPVRRLLLH